MLQLGNFTVYHDVLKLLNGIEKRDKRDKPLSPNLRPFEECKKPDSFQAEMAFFSAGLSDC